MELLFLSLRNVRGVSDMSEVAHFYCNVSNVPGIEIRTRAKTRDYIEEPFCGSRPRLVAAKPRLSKVLLANPPPHVVKYLLPL